MIKHKLYGCASRIAQAVHSPTDKVRMGVIELLRRPLTTDMSLAELKAAVDAKAIALKTVEPAMTADALAQVATLRRMISEIERLNK